MPITSLNIDSFLEKAQNHPVFDVRSPGEYLHAQIPGAVSLPLFSDEERAVIGTTYKQVNRESAIKIGLDYFGPKIRSMVETVEQHTESLSENRSNFTPAPKPVVLVHCWRGGMRSGAVAWLLDLYGFEVYLLQGGYKAFRNKVLDTFQKDYSLKIIGGYTGSGKTYILQKLSEKGFQTVDLEHFASHRGSALGGINLPPQPSQEMFENLLAIELLKLNPASDIFLEDESRRIGQLNIPGDFYEKMSPSPLYFLNVPFEKRLDFLVSEYGIMPQEALSDSITRIKKRLGGLEEKNAQQHLAEGNIKECFRILLRYYDKFYKKDLEHKQEVGTPTVLIETQDMNLEENTNLIISKL